MNETSAYIPGVCNINHDEIKKRQIGGIIGVVVYVIFFILTVFVSHVYFLRFIVILPALMATVGFVQARSHFCVAFGTSGKENATDGNPKPQAVIDADSIATDKTYSKKLLFTAAGYAAILLVIALVCPPFH